MARWTFSAFDWARFRVIAPQVKLASDISDFRTLTIENAAEILAALEERLPNEAICNALIMEICTPGSVAEFDGNLPEAMRLLRRHPQGADAFDDLTELTFNSSEVEDWFRYDKGIVGLFTPTHASALARHLQRYTRAVGAKAPVAERGPWIRLGQKESAGHALAQLGQVVEEAAAGRFGLAAAVD